MNTENLVLRPNCLLTRYPLVFITGKRSLFYKDKLAADLQDFMIAHGYMVKSPIMPFRDLKIRELALKNWLSQQPEKQFHFVLSEQTLSDHQELFLQYKNNGSSFNIGGKNIATIGPAKPTLSYRLHQTYCRFMGTNTDLYEQTLPDSSLDFLNRFLDHCIELAENDHI